MFLNRVPVAYSCLAIIAPDDVCVESDRLLCESEHPHYGGWLPQVWSHRNLRGFRKAKIVDEEFRANLERLRFENKQSH